MPTAQIENCDDFAALHEETDKGWVWLFLDKPFVSRMTIKISRDERSVYCEYREIDENFVELYNEKPHTTNISVFPLTAKIGPKSA